MQVVRKNAIGTNHSLPSQAERLISAVRVILAAFALFAIWLDPSEPARHAVTTYSLLAGYLFYAVVLALTAWHADVNWTHPALVVHAVDLLIFTVFMFLTTGHASPFFAFFIFSLVCATLRWQMRGTIYTVIIAIGVVIVVTVYQAVLLNDPEFELDCFVIRIGYLLVVAIMLGYMGAYEQKRHGEISRLAAWPRMISEEISPLVRETLRHASGILAAPRMLATWEEGEEPLLHVALWSEGEFRYTREPPDVFGSLVAERLAETDFLCPDSRAPAPSVLHAAPAGFQRWQGLPLHPELQRRFSMKTVLSFALRGESVTGRMFAIDKARLNPDDLIFGRIVAREVSNDLVHFHLLKRLRQTAATEERIRLARDLHDGLLQSLTGAALQLETVRQLMEKDPQTAQQRLLDIQNLLSAEQQNLRSHIRQLKPPYPDLTESDVDLAGRLKELTERIDRQWGPHVTLKVELDRNRFPWGLANEIYFIVHEALINAARHAKATTLHAEIKSDRNRIHIAVFDNGCGFPFRGCHDLAALTEMNLGPVILRERVASLGGGLILVSDESGTRLGITIPIVRKEG